MAPPAAPLPRPRTLAALRPTVRAEADRLVDELVRAGGGDAVTELAAPLPLTVLTAALGLPDDAPLGSRLFNLEVDIRPVQQRKLDSVAAHRTQVQGGDPRRFLFDGLLDAVLDVERFRYATESRIADWPLQPPAG